MKIITETAALAALCADYARSPYVTVDTEFMRERTYYPQLCLAQIARPFCEGDEEAGGDAAIIDPMAEGVDLAPLMALMADVEVVKVFHAARQDVEIFWNIGGRVPAPLFDTQVAAMVCGYGDQVGYETLVRKIARGELDKSSRFTDWSRRPLSAKQLDYALGDVTHLRVIYETLSEKLRRTGRGPWVAEEMGVLTDPATYENEPSEAWRRVKTRSHSPKFLAVVRALAAWREETAQRRDLPRNRVMKDDALLELASSRPRSLEEMSGLRLLQREARKTEAAEAILAAIRAAEAEPPEARPAAPRPAEPRQGAGALVELLKVLLKARSEETGVAQRLIASSADLDAIARDAEPDVPALSGWRRDVFGAAALQLKRGELALTATPRGVQLVDLAAAAE